ncbi:MAG: NTP transferase domain-containing protein [Candidatus Omnitrophica bacterium]|nr:NTP transferase domain-containing protein [Candidatus Omnitrophota bacterium]
MRKQRAAIILAAGKGVRMKSALPKALCELSGKPMVRFLIDAAKSSGIDKIVVVGGYKIGLLKKALSGEKVKIVQQKNLLGSADAVKQAQASFKGFKGDILVLYADTPLIKAATLKALLKRHAAARADLTLLTGATENPGDYGRVQRDENDRVCAIIEHTDISRAVQEPSQISTHEINIGAYCFDSKCLFDGLKKIRKNRIKKEFYLTDIISYFYQKDYRISSYVTDDESEMLGINRREELIIAEDLLRERTILKHLAAGVTIKDPGSAYIQEGAKIAKNVVIYPFVVIDRDVVVGKNCRVGPFAHLRKGTVLEDGSEVGNFVEIVRSRIGVDSKVKHHSYLGDTVVGRKVNVGAGTITANYDGKKKSMTVIEDGAFLGSGTTIVAPVKIGKEAITGAGSVVVKGKDVPPRTVVVGVPAKPLKSLRRGR